MHTKLDCRSKLDLKSKRCIFIGYGIGECGYRFWNPENRKILKHKDMIFDERMVYKDLLMKRSTPEQQSSVADSEFIELDVLVEKIQSILERNEESQIEPPIPKLR